MEHFIFQYPVRQHFGKGCAEEAVKKEMESVGSNVLLAYGGSSLKRTGLYDKICSWLAECGKNVTDFGGITPNPTYAKAQEGARIVREQGIDFILAVGGGSVIDCCKIVSAQARTDADIWEMEYTGHLLPTEFVPMGAVVTASGTGAEQFPVPYGDAGGVESPHAVAAAIRRIALDFCSDGPIHAGHYAGKSYLRNG